MSPLFHASFIISISFAYMFIADDNNAISFHKSRHVELFSMLHRSAQGRLLMSLYHGQHITVEFVNGRLFFIKYSSSCCIKNFVIKGNNHNQKPTVKYREIMVF